jgi:hypothetical protein
LSFLDTKNINDIYQETKEHHKKYFTYFDEYERLARNRPSPKIDKNLPKTTDGTLAGIIKEQPKRVIQQIPTGKVNCSTYPELAEVAGHVLTNELIPLGTTQGSAIQKGWIMLNKALTYGVSVSYTYFTNTGDRMHTDFVIPYIKDILIEKGKTYGPDSNIEFMRSWYTKYDIMGIIQKEQRLMKKDAKYKPEWDLKQLQALLDAGITDQKDDDQTPHEREKGSDAGGFEIIHGFQRGVKEKFYSFAPVLGDKNIVKTKINPDPRGESPLNYLYCDIDLSNPYGRGAVEQSGGIQNLLDHQMVMFQFMNTLLMGPPLQLWGNLNKSTIKFKPNAIWDMGANQNNKIEPFQVNTSAINNFPNNYGLLKSQILNLNSSLDSSVSATSGNPGFSKTPAGVKNNETRLSISDNYMRKQFEKWYGDQSETSLNIFFAEMEGKGEVEIGEDQVSKMTEETLKKYYSKKTGKLSIPYSTIKDETFKFIVDASSSQVKEDADNAEKLTELLRISQNVLTDDQKYKLVKAIGDEIGAKNLDKIFPEPESVAGEKEKEAMAMQMMQAQGQQAGVVGEQVPNTPPDASLSAGGTLPQPGGPMMPPQPPPPQIDITRIYKDLPEDVKRQVEQLAGLQPSQGQSPIQEKIDVDKQKIAVDAHLKADDQAHNHELGIDQHVSQASQPEQTEQPQEEQDPEVEAFSQKLQEMGFAPEDIEQAETMLQQNVPVDEILQVLTSKGAM